MFVALEDIELRTRRIIRNLWSLIPPIAFDIILTFDLFQTQGSLYFPGGINPGPFEPISAGLDLVTSSWSPANFGMPNAPNPLTLLVYLLQLTLNNPKLVVVTITLLPYWISTISMWILLQKSTFRTYSTIAAGPKAALL